MDFELDGGNAADFMGGEYFRRNSGGVENGETGRM